MLCFPLKNYTNRIIGAVQLINRISPVTGKPVPFDRQMAALVTPVARVVGANIERTDMLEQIRSATTLILSGKDKYEEAERSLNEVEYRLSYSRRVKVWSDSIAYPLLAYEVFWLLVLGLGALFIPSILSTAITRVNGFSPNSLPDFIQFDDLFLGVSTALWGGLGGVVGAMYALWRHVSLKQDFNPQHKMWYYTQPIMGIPIGVVIFLIVRIGIGFTIEGVLDFASPYAIYMMAWIAGFQQNVLYEIIRQILKLFRVNN